MNLTRISDESRHDDEQAARAAMRENSPPLHGDALCDCLENAQLCPECQQKLARYGPLLSRHRHLSHEVAGVLGCFGDHIPAAARGKLRAAFVEDSMPYLADFGDRFWERLAGTILEQEG